MMDFKKPHQTIFYSIEKAIKLYRQMAQKNIRDTGHDITIDQLLLIMAIQENPEISQTKLAKLIFKDYASVTRMIELLVKKSIIKRAFAHADRRRKQLSITNLGLDMIEQLKPIVSHNRKVALDGLTKSQLNRLDKVLNEIIINCGHVASPIQNEQMSG